MSSGKLSQSTFSIVLSYLPEDKILPKNVREEVWYYKISHFLRRRIPSFSKALETSHKKVYEDLLDYEGVHISLYVFFSRSLLVSRKYVEWSINEMIKYNLLNYLTPDYSGFYWEWVLLDLIEHNNNNNKEYFKFFLDSLPRSHWVKESRDIFYIFVTRLDEMKEMSKHLSALSLYEIFLQKIDPSPETFYDNDEEEDDDSPKRHFVSLNKILDLARKHTFPVIENYLLAVLREGEEKGQ